MMKVVCIVPSQVGQSRDEGDAHTRDDEENARNVVDKVARSQCEIGHDHVGGNDELGKHDLQGTTHPRGAYRADDVARSVCGIGK